MNFFWCLKFIVNRSRFFPIRLFVYLILSSTNSYISKKLNICSTIKQNKVFPQLKFKRINLVTINHKVKIIMIIMLFNGNLVWSSNIQYIYDNIYVVTWTGTDMISYNNRTSCGVNTVNWWTWQRWWGTVLVTVCTDTNFTVCTYNNIERKYSHFHLFSIR